MSDGLLLLLRTNLAAAVAVGVVMLLRRPARRLFGARIAYGLWSLVPLAAAATVLPARVVTVVQAAEAARVQAVDWGVQAGSAAPLARPGLDPAAILGAVWLLGALGAFLHLARRQSRFDRAVRAGRAGPAVVGLWRPRIVTPRDFADRYSPGERDLVLTHERTHIERRDPGVNALVALACCVNWFNPLIHLLAHCLRIDQELACDAQVVAAHPARRRAYAEAMLKTQLAARPLPLGCYWPSQSAHPLAERIGLLSRRPPGRAGRHFGVTLTVLLALGGGFAAWAAQPARIVAIPAAVQASPAPPSARVTPDAPSPAAPARAVAPPARVKASPAEVEASLPPPAPLQATLDAAQPPSPPLAPGEFGPRKVHALADWSVVEPGSAVRVLATMTDPDGVELVTDLTAFGSQSWYRLGYIRRASSRYKLFTSVVQRGDRLLVTAGLNRSFDPMVTGRVELASGETGQIRLPNGMVAAVTPTLRPETPEEIAQARRTGDRRFVNVSREDAL